MYDPEIPVDIYSLGLIYEIDVSESNDVHIEMTLTSPACPVAGTLPPEIEQRVKNEVSACKCGKSGCSVGAHVDNRNDERTR